MLDISAIRLIPRLPTDVEGIWRKDGHLEFHFDSPIRAVDGNVVKLTRYRADHHLECDLIRACKSVAPAHFNPDPLICADHELGRLDAILDSGGNFAGVVLRRPTREEISEIRRIGREEQGKLVSG